MPSIVLNITMNIIRVSGIGLQSARGTRIEIINENFKLKHNNMY